MAVLLLIQESKWMNQEEYLFYPKRHGDIKEAAFKHALLLRVSIKA